MQRIQQLSVTDYVQRVDFMRCLLDATENDSQFLNFFLFVDKATFPRDDVVNTNNVHTWVRTNPHTALLSNAQKRFSLNIWSEVLKGYLIGPYLLSECLNGNMYLALM